MILAVIFLAILYIALAVMLIAFSFVIFLARKKIKNYIEKLKNATRIRIEIKRVKKSHI